MVIGTTGLDAAAQAAVDAGAKRIAICQAANFSIGVNLLLDLVARAAADCPKRSMSKLPRLITAGRSMRLPETRWRWAGQWPMRAVRTAPQPFAVQASAGPAKSAARSCAAGTWPGQPVAGSRWSVVGGR